MKAAWPDRLPDQAAVGSAAGPLLRTLRGMAAREFAPPGELAAWQAAQLKALLRHCAARSPAFAKRLRRARLDPASPGPAALRELAPLTRADIVAAGNTFWCRDWPREHGEFAVVSTSGSTGEPLSVRRTGRCQLVWMANTLREHLWHGRDFSRRLMAVRASVAVRTPSRGWGRPASLLFRTGPALALPVTTGVEEACRELLDFAPSYLLAPPSTLAAMLDILGPGDWPDGLLCLRAFSETVSANLRERVRSVAGVPLHDMYSSQELGVIAMECPISGRLHVADHLIVEVLREDGGACAPGESGRVVVTDLVNYASPLIRYELGDHAEAGEPCACGRSLPVLNRVLGRRRNLVVYPDGSRHWPLVGFARFGEVLPVRQFQFVQESPVCLEARLVAERPATAAEEDALRRIIRDSIGYSFDIRFRWFQEPLPRGPGGKFEEFISHCD